MIPAAKIKLIVDTYETLEKEDSIDILCLNEGQGIFRF